MAIAGGVSANSALRAGLQQLGKERAWRTFIPAFQFCTDNAGMIGVTAHFKYLAQEFVSQEVSAVPRWKIGSEGA